jgi:hypothetical protein
LKSALSAGTQICIYEVGGYTGTVYHCKECGYIGAFVIEADKGMIEKISKE